MSKYQYDGDVRLIQPDPDHSQNVKLYHRGCEPAGEYVIVKERRELDDVFLGVDGEPRNEKCHGCGREIKVITTSDT